MKTKVGRKGEGHLCVLCIAATFLGGCLNTTTTQTVTTPVVEERTRVDPDEPLVASSWQLNGSKITGHVTWASCTASRSRVVKEPRTDHQRPIPVIGGA